MVVQKKINKFTVKPVNIENVEEKRIGGSELFPSLYPNVLIVAKKHSGKTTIVSNIIDKCSNKKTTIFFFVPTASKDATYQKIFKSLNERKINYECFTDIEDSDGNILGELITQLRNEENEDDILQVKKKEIIGTGHPVCFFGGETEEQRLKKQMKKIEKEEERLKKLERKSKQKVYPKYILVMDDLSTSLRHRTVELLCKTNRHLKMMTIISCHSINDIKPSTRKNIDYCLISSSLNLEKLEDLHRDLNISIPFEDFLSIYEEATKNSRYDYLFIDTLHEKFRKNFNIELTV